MIWQKQLQFLWHWFARVMAVALFFTYGYLLSADLLGRIAVNRDFVPASAEEGVIIYVISNGIHTDIVVPAQSEFIDWTAVFPPETFTPPVDQPAYVAFGWGEQNLYDKVPTWDKLTTSIFINAVVLPSKSSMHITYWEKPLQTGDRVKRIIISPEQYTTLIGLIQETIFWDENGNPVNQDCCWYPAVSDNFYDSPPQYHLFSTCNHWTIRVLKETGLPTPVWTPFPQDIMRHLDPVSS